MPCAIGAFLQEASEFRHHSHQTSLDVCEMDGLRCLQLKKELFYGKLSSFLEWKTVQFNLNVMRQSACLVFNPIMVDNYAAFFNCTPVGRASDSMMAPT